MGEFKRVAIYVVPTGPLYALGAAWLGWDSVQGQTIAHPDVHGLPEPVEALTETPRKYGFHGTMKPPFRLAAGTDLDALDAACATFCAARVAVHVPSIALRRLGRFFAIVTRAPSAALAELASATVTELDSFRAPLTDTDLARRRRAKLSARQDALLEAWGYPYVLDQFRFHLTLTGPVAPANADATEAALADHVAPVLQDGLEIDSLCLLGEADDGRFHMIQRYTLSG